MSMGEPKTEPIIRCPEAHRDEALRELVIRSGRVQREMHDLQNAARELGVEVFAAHIGKAGEMLTEAKDEFVRRPR